MKTTKALKNLAEKYEARAEYMKLTDAHVLEADALSIAKTLRKASKVLKAAQKADHDVDCNTVQGWGKGNQCDCWKADLA